jgi:hypothetical protein
MIKIYSSIFLVLIIFINVSNLESKPLVIPQTGVLSGFVYKYRSGKSVSAVCITICDQKKDVFTDLKGEFFIRNIPVGKHIVLVHMSEIDKKDTLECEIKYGQETYMKIAVDIQRKTESNIIYSDLPSGMINGRLFNLIGESCPGYEIAIENLQKKSLTDYLGDYSFQNIAAGVYTLVVYKNGKKLETYNNVIVNSGSIVHVDLIDKFRSRIGTFFKPPLFKGILTGEINTADGKKYFATFVQRTVNGNVAYSDENGYFCFSGVNEGFEKLFISPEGNNGTEIGSIPVVGNFITHVKINYDINRSFIEGIEIYSRETEEMRQNSPYKRIFSIETYTPGS